jgi:hypothetical protein
MDQTAPPTLNESKAETPKQVVSLDTIADYLVSYTQKYRQEYARLIEAPPKGAGFPDIVKSPYLERGNIELYLARDGAVLMDTTEPEYDWYIAGGPALMVDYPDPNSRVPESVKSILRSAGILGKPAGIYRLVFPPEKVPNGDWPNDLPAAIEKLSVSVPDGPYFNILRLDLPWNELISQLTFGAYGPILDVHLPATSNINFWQPMIVRKLGFLTADREHRRFLQYCEFIRHTEGAAWDKRGIWARSKVDVQRDLANAIAMSEKDGATMSFGENQHDVLIQIRDRLARLETAVKGLEELLLKDPGADERLYQKFLEENPLLIDIYGEVMPRPRLEYPEGTSPYDKTFIEPDFIVRRPGNRYRLIEIERPSKKMATKAGQARAEVTQASFQISEFKDFIREHHDAIKDRFPRIHRSTTSTMIISRATEESFGGRSNIRRQLLLLEGQLGVEELLTYDDLLSQAKVALQQLAGIAPDVCHPPVIMDTLSLSR